jgi:hypothetical protein
MSEVVTPIHDIIILLICTVVILAVLVMFLYCNYYGGACPGKWVCNYLGITIGDAVGGVGKIIVNGIRVKLCDVIPV